MVVVVEAIPALGARRQSAGVVEAVGVLADTTAGWAAACGCMVAEEHLVERGGISSEAHLAILAHALCMSPEVVAILEQQLLAAAERPNGLHTERDGAGLTMLIQNQCHVGPCCCFLA